MWFVIIKWHTVVVNYYIQTLPLKTFISFTFMSDSLNRVAYLYEINYTLQYNHF